MKQQVIVCAANKITFADGSEQILLGARHWDQMMHNHWQSLDPNLGLLNRKVSEVQGFIDQCGVFFTREDAWAVAENAGQIKYRVGSDEYTDKNGEQRFRLFSENLY